MVLNHDRFDPLHMFHEIWTLYARWLSEYNPGARALMENVQNTYRVIFLGTAMYNTRLKAFET
jgi:hypothetical protein